MMTAAPYTAERTTRDGIEVIRLYHRDTRTEVLVAPSLGNNAYAMSVNGKPIFWSPYGTVGELKAKPAQAGNPFLAPWANRLDRDGFYANGKKFLLNPALNNFRRDGNGNPIHGLLVFAPQWKVVRLEAGSSSAEVTSRLDFDKVPEYMAQFPFAHVIEMTYRLSGSELEVRTAIENHSSEPMPLCIGFHTYYQITDAPRDEWMVHIPATEQVVLSKLLIPTGAMKPVILASPLSLRNNQLDDVYTGLVKDEAGSAEFWVRGREQQITVLFGPKYRVGVVYAPPGRDFICFEPMTAITDAFNLHHSGLYSELPSVPAGGSWQESFRIRATGFSSKSRR